MATTTSEFTVDTRGENSTVNITEMVSDIVSKSGTENGIAHIFVRSTTSSVLICEDEEGLLRDIVEAGKRFAPDNLDYRHNEAWHDDNGRSHVKASFLGQSLSVPIVESSLSLGTWQSIFLIEFDVRPRKRSIVVSIFE